MKHNETGSVVIGVVAHVASISMCITICCLTVVAHHGAGVALARHGQICVPDPQLIASRNCSVQNSVPRWVWTIRMMGSPKNAGRFMGNKTGDEPKNCGL